jgi:hypothetical protein
MTGITRMVEAPEKSELTSKRIGTNCRRIDGNLIPLQRAFRETEGPFLLF